MDQEDPYLDQGVHTWTKGAILDDPECPEGDLGSTQVYLLVAPVGSLIGGNLEVFSFDKVKVLVT